MKSLRNEATDKLFDAILCLENRDDCYAFFEDLCTINEIKSMAQRLEVAFLLDEGLNYQEIANNTNVSSGTISRIRRSFDYGTGGYEKIIRKLKENQSR